MSEQQTWAEKLQAHYNQLTQYLSEAATDQSLSTITKIQLMYDVENAAVAYRHMLENPLTIDLISQISERRNNDEQAE